MRVIFDKSDLVKILGKHFGMPISSEDVTITADPLEIDVRSIGEMPVSAPPKKEATVAEELHRLLTTAQQHVEEEQEEKGVGMPKSDESPTTIFSLEDLLNPDVSKNVSKDEVQAAKKKQRPPSPPLPKLNDYFDGDGDSDENVHYDDPGEMTPAELDAAKRKFQKGSS